VLSITPTASQAIEEILETPDASEEAGVRIEARPADDDAAGAAFQLAVVLAPIEGDEVIAGGNVFIEPDASRMLEQSELDAEIEAGQMRFTLQHRAA